METENRDNSVYNALRRLERVGSEHSRTTARLIESARVLGEHIAQMLPPVVLDAVAVYYSEKSQNDHADEELPRGYVVAHCWGNAAGSVYDMLGQIVGRDGHYDFEAVDSNREAALDFARDIADGWLDDLAAWLLKRTDEDNDAVLRLETAARAIQDKQHVQPVPAASLDDIEDRVSALEAKSFTDNYMDNR